MDIVDPVSDLYDVPSVAEFIQVNPFRLRFKDLTFSSVHMKSKMWPGSSGFKVLIAPAPGVLGLSEVTDLFRVASKYVAAIRRESKSVALK